MDDVDVAHMCLFVGDLSCATNEWALEGGLLGALPSSFPCHLLMGTVVAGARECLCNSGNS